MKKIIFVDIEYDYGLKERGLNIIGQSGFLKSFKELGYDVTSFYYDSYIANNNIDQLQNDLLAIAEKVRPDFIYFCIFRDHFKKETLLKLKEKFTTINWFGDDSWRFDSFTKNYANLFTYAITTDKYSISKYQTLGVTPIVSQWAAIGEICNNAKQEYKYDVTFIGGFNRYRKWFIDTLLKANINVEAFGHGWKNGPVSHDKMIEIFQTSKINLNIANSISFDFRYFLNSPLNIVHSFHSKKVGSQIKARNFEIPYYGGLQLTDYVPGIEDYFDIGKECLCYKDSDDAVMLINHYLNDGRSLVSEEREKIKKAGIKKASTHNYKNRVCEFMKMIDL